MPKWIDDEYLIFDLMFVLARIKLKPKGPEQDEIYRRLVAQQIVDHLKLANWKSEKGPPLPHHG